MILIEKDSTGITFKYRLIDDIQGITIMSGDGENSVDSILNFLNLLNKSLGNNSKFSYTLLK